MSKEEMTRETNREIDATTRWGIGLLLALVIQGGTAFYWASAINSQVQQNAKDIAATEDEVNDIESDIRAILVGIEQVKARMGIVESQ